MQTVNAVVASVLAAERAIPSARKKMLAVVALFTCRGGTILPDLRISPVLPTTASQPVQVPAVEVEQVAPSSLRQKLILALRLIASERAVCRAPTSSLACVVNLLL